jgi:excisionase family DNA binding protein
MTVSDPSADDRSLARSALAGDLRAWTALIHRHTAVVRGAVRKVRGDRVSEVQLDAIAGEVWIDLLAFDMQGLNALIESAEIELFLSNRAAVVSRELPLVSERRSFGKHVSPMMRVEEVAQRWDVNVKTVYGMIERGQLEARRFGRVIRLPRHVVESFEQASVVPGGQKPCR